MRFTFRNALFLLFLALFAPTGQASALEAIAFKVSGSDEDLKKSLERASLVLAARNETAKDTRDLFAAALAEYGQLTQALYANGYYGGTVRVLVDGREAARIAPFSLPRSIRKIEISVNPGKPFRFGTARVAPVRDGTDLPENFRRGEIAKSGLIQKAADAAVEGWRDAGHAKAALSGQQITANHANAELSAALAVAPGPKVIFGTLRRTTPSAVRANRIAQIAGFPKGEVFSPKQLDTVARRLRRTGAFSSVSLTEAKALHSGNVLDVDLALVDEKPRRFGFGAELSSFEGLSLTGFWMHRNFLGGAERFRLDGEISDIGAQSRGVDYRLGVRLEQPASFGPDTSAFGHANLTYEEEPGYTLQSANLGAGITHIFSDRLEAEFGATIKYSETKDYRGDRRFFLLTLPTTLTWDRRDNTLDATKGTYLKAEVTPFVSLDSGKGGGRIFADGRTYHSLGADDRFVVAGRVQVGSVIADNVADVPPNYLFYSGGGGTVRGQPYKSLGLPVGTNAITGGQSFVSLSAELRAGITDKIGVVGFVDAGHVAAGSFFDNAGRWHAGAGLGLRYKTSIGPLRVDVAGPISGDTGAGVQLYLGIGQAF